jgi:hypothetical protein
LGTAVKADLRPEAAFAQAIELSFNVEVTGAAWLYRAAPVWTPWFAKQLHMPEEFLQFDHQARVLFRVFKYL